MNTSLQKKKIMVIDDAPDVLFILKTALIKENYEIICASDGEEALGLIQKILPDAIVMDVMMPKMDGHTVALRLKENETTKEIPVILMTGKGDLKELLDIKENIDVAAYFEKPFKVTTLKERIKELLD